MVLGAYNFIKKLTSGAIDITPLRLNMDELKITVNRLWYLHDHVILSLFTDHIPSHLHGPIGEGIRIEGIDLHEAHMLDQKCTNSPSLSLNELPLSLKPKIKKEKHILKKATAIPAAGIAITRDTTSTAAPPSVGTMNDILLA